MSVLAWALSAGTVGGVEEVGGVPMIPGFKGTLGLGGAVLPAAPVAVPPAPVAIPLVPAAPVAVPPVPAAPVAVPPVPAPR
jgi:hypothetical protein